jgi:hypothetical protein
MAATPRSKSIRSSALLGMSTAAVVRREAVTVE